MATQSTVASGTLYVVATPIGNLEDITLRALRILKAVDLVAAEDTRHSRKLFNHYGIQTPLTSYFAHNEAQKGEQLLASLRTGKSVALITDAGTPAISDPGYLLVQRCHAEGIAVAAVPGPSAVTTALSMAGLPSERFVFEGFLPSRQKACRERLEQLATEARTVVCYESPKRLLKSLALIDEICGTGRTVAVVRELTKIHEELVAGSAAELAEHFQSGVRGEIVLLLGPVTVPEPGSDETVREALLRVSAESGLPMRQVVKQVARQFGLPGSEVYRESLTLRGARQTDDNE